MELLNKQFSPASCHFIPLRYKCPPQHPGHKHPQSCGLRLKCKTRFHSHTNQQIKLQFCVSYPINLYVFRQQTKRKRFWTARQQAFPEFSPLLISSWMQFRFVPVVRKYLNFATLKWFINCLHVKMILSCSLVTRHEHF
jgi:hypothetical protein